MIRTRGHERLIAELDRQAEARFRRAMAIGPDRSNPSSLGDVLSALTDQGATCRIVAKRVGLARGTTRRHLLTLRDQGKAIVEDGPGMGRLWRRA